jgi:signal transduction histidine kinase
LATTSAFLYIAGPPVIALEYGTRIVTSPLLRLLRRSGKGESRTAPRNAGPETAGARTPPLDPHTAEHWAKLDRLLDREATRAVGGTGQVIRFASFSGVCHSLGLDPLFGILCAEIATLVYLIAIHLAFPLPTSAVLGREEQGFVEEERLDLAYLVNVVLPLLVYLIYLGFAVGGLAAAASFSLATLGPHYVFRLLEGRRGALLRRNRQLASASDALRDANAALEAKQQELRTLVYAVTHDLKGPLNTIHLTADIALERSQDALTAEARTDLERIAHLAGATEEMIKDLLGMFQILYSPEDSSQVDLHSLVLNRLDALREQIDGKRITISLEPLPEAWGQPAKLSHVLDNLLGNAVKYVRPGGRVALSALASDSGVLISIADNGIGIPTAYHLSIFDLFTRVPAEEYRLDEVPARGTGVGLAVARQIVEGHEGRIWVESDLGRGAAFYVWLPAYRGQAAESVAGGKKRSASTLRVS